MENTEKKLPVKNLERISEKTFKTYAEANEARGFTQVWKKGEEPVKAKIFARYNGTFDLVFYKKIKKEEEKKVEVKAETPVVEEKKVVHGQKSKDRKKPQK